jgi:mitogen-activated protein kinase kinase 4
VKQEESERPKYNKLLGHPFLLQSEAEEIDTAGYVTGILDRHLLPTRRNFSRLIHKDRI